MTGDEDDDEEMPEVPQKKDKKKKEKKVSQNGEKKIEPLESEVRFEMVLIAICVRMMCTNTLL